MKRYEPTTVYGTAEMREDSDGEYYEAREVDAKVAALEQDIRTMWELINNLYQEENLK